MAGAELYAHLAGGVTTVCRVWSVLRRDGLAFGLTDHDRDLVFDGLTFRADAGVSARALQQGTGLSVDNSEVMGALSHASVAEGDLSAGRFDGAEVRCWLVNWADVADRVELFRGSFGEITRGGDGTFRAELRGLTEALNRVQGRVFHAGCGAVLGDARCRFDLDQPGFHMLAPVVDAGAGQLRLADGGGFADGWFTGGRVMVTTGAAMGLMAAVRRHVVRDGMHLLDLWPELPVAVTPGDMLRLEAGCDRKATTCRQKFGNFLNFRGFPHIPGEDWLSAYPRDGQSHDGRGWTT